MASGLQAWATEEASGVFSLFAIYKIKSFFFLFFDSSCLSHTASHDDDDCLSRMLYFQLYFILLCLMLFFLAPKRLFASSLKHTPSPFFGGGEDIRIYIDLKPTPAAAAQPAERTFLSFTAPFSNTYVTNIQMLKLSTNCAYVYTIDDDFVTR